MEQTRRLIEEWLPIDEIGIESVRERTPMTPFPAPNRLHVWWARRPLVASRAAVLASLLPADADRDKFMHALGIHGDPVATRQKLDEAKRTGENLGLNPYGYARAFSYSSSEEEKQWLIEEAGKLGINNPTVIDPTAGGGSIPFESIRLGLTTYANDLNPVASFVEKMTFEMPMLGEKVLTEFQRLNKRFVKLAEPRYEGIFPQEPNDTQILAYLWARTIRCPHCGGLIPLSPNWKLAPDGTGVRLIPHCEKDISSRVCTFEIVHSAKEQSAGTVAGGRAMCPYEDCGMVIDGDQVKNITQSEGMGEQIFAIVYKKQLQTITKTGKPGRVKWERGYRVPQPEDDVIEVVKARLAEKLPEWEAMDIVPSEVFPTDSNDDRPIQYGMPLWRDLFSPRQLYCHCTSVEVFRELLAEEEAKPGFGEVQKAAFAYLALALDKVLNYNCRMTRWIVDREVVAGKFDRHDFAFKWSYAEMAPLIVGLGYDWALEQTEKCLIELTDLLRPDFSKDELKTLSSSKCKATPTSSRSLLDYTSATAAEPFTPPKTVLTCGSGDYLLHIDDHSIDAVVMDPPYYNNVMYAELSDFFYVWLKRTAGLVYPDLFTLMTTDKENEAVANPAKFKGMKGAAKLANDDYRDRMASIFKECRRVLKEDGVLMLMFTHKATGAWDALAKGLFDAGFIITASWPVNTEASGSLHIKDKAAANSTIFLVCRPRPEQIGESLFWEDLEPLVYAKVLERIDSFQRAGIGGIDLCLASFGPALEEFSRHWPVKRGTPRPKPVVKKRVQASLLDEGVDPYAATPEDVLHTARSAVKQWMMKQILTVQRRPLAPLTEFYVLAWSLFKAPTFPFDEALGLARVVGLDTDEIIGTIAEKKQSDVILWDSKTRAAKNTLGPADGSRAMLDALHRAANMVHENDLSAAKEMLEELGLHKDPQFQDALAAMLEVLPVSRTFSGYESSSTLAPYANDFEALEKIRQILLADSVKQTKRIQGSLLNIDPEAFGE